MFRLQIKLHLKTHGAVERDSISYMKTSNRRGEVKRTSARSDHRNERGYGMYRGVYLGKLFRKLRLIVVF